METWNQVVVHQHWTTTTRVEVCNGCVAYVVGWKMGEDEIAPPATNATGRTSVQPTRMALCDTVPGHPREMHLLRKIANSPVVGPVQRQN